MIEFDKAQFAYELANIQLRYEVIHSQELTDETLSNHKNGKRFIYEHVTHLETISVDEGSGTIISESINVPRRSMKGLLLSFFTSNMLLVGEKSEMTFNPNITEVKVIVSGIPN